MFLYASRVKWRRKLPTWWLMWVKFLLTAITGLQISCAFEDGTHCGWKQDVDHEADWILHHRATPTEETGPLYDHTFGREGDGKYNEWKWERPFHHVWLMRVDVKSANEWCSVVERKRDEEKVNEGESARTVTGGRYFIDVNCDGANVGAWDDRVTEHWKVAH